MPLAPGTALQNGHYVIDALLEAAPNGDLYWGTHVAAGLPVFIQVFPVGEPAQGDLGKLMAQLEGIAFSPQSPLPNPFQLFHGDGQTLCLAMSTVVGLPWSVIRKSRSPLSTRQSLATVRQLADHLAWLKTQGLQGLDLSPNRVWLSQETETVTVTGLPHAYLQNSASPDNIPDTSVQALAQLLFSFLTGHLLSWPSTADSLSVRAQLKAHCPNVSPLIITAIERALAHSEPEESPITVLQWLQLLPDAEPNTRVATSRQSPISSSPTPNRTMPEVSHSASVKQGSWLLPSLAATAMLAAIAGGALGTYWRLNTQSLPGAIRLEPKQSFPPQANWSGDTPEAEFDTPYVPASNIPVRRDRWYETPTSDRNNTIADEPINTGVIEPPEGFNAPSSFSDVNPTSTASPSTSGEASTDRPSFTNTRPVEPLDTPKTEPAGLESLQVPEVISQPEAGPADAPAPRETSPSSSSMAIPKAAPAPETATES